MCYIGTLHEGRSHSPLSRPNAAGAQSLRLAVSLSVFVPVMAVIALGGWLALHSLERQTVARMQDDIRLVAETLRPPLGYSLELGRTGAVASALDSARRLGLVYGIYVYDRDGQRVASVGTQRGEISTEEVQALAVDGQRSAEFEEFGGEELFSYFQPLTDAGGQIIGLLHVTRRGEDFDNYLTRLRLGAVALLLLAGALMAAILFFGHHRAVGRHVQDMCEAMRQVAAGAHTHRVPVQGPGELRVLAEGVNGMLDAIEQSREEIERRRQAELDLRAQLGQAEKLAAIGQLAAGVAHELGTPLATVDGHAQQALRSTAQLPDHEARRFARIRTEVSRMSHIVRQLMDFGRRNPLRRRDTDALQLVHTAISHLPDEGQTATPRIEIDVPSPAPRIAVDPVRADQALVNLLRNACQAASSCVRIGWHADARGQGFVVEDDGAGIAAEHLEHLFEPFFTTKDVGAGTGLGLAVVHTIAQAHDGTITVDESPLGGARFILLLEPPT